MKPLLFLFFCLVFISCSKGDKVPKSVLQPEKMGEVIWDVMRMQFLAEEKAAADTTVNQEEELNRLTESVFVIHNITPKKFDNSYNWYVKHPTLLKRIFDSLHVQKNRQNAEGLEVTEEASEHGPAKRKLERRNKEGVRQIE